MCLTFMNTLRVLWKRILVQCHLNIFSPQTWHHLLSFVHYFFLSILLWPENYNEALWSKYAEYQAKTGGQNGKYLHSHSKFSRRADVRWDKRDPHSTEYQHAEGDELGFIEIIWEVASQDCQDQATQS